MREWIDVGYDDFVMDWSNLRQIVVIESLYFTKQTYRFCLSQENKAHRIPPFSLFHLRHKDLPQISRSSRRPLSLEMAETMTFIIPFPKYRDSQIHCCTNLCLLRRMNGIDQEEKT
jgi:hypothetical protein